MSTPNVPVESIPSTEQKRFLWAALTIFAFAVVVGVAGEAFWLFLLFLG